jgi:hypothetical protein
MATTYEWKVEELISAEDRDILDVHHWTTYAEAVANAPKDHVFEICLVRNVGNDEDGITDRKHAYVNKGVLSEHFDEGGVPPKQYAAEVARFHAVRKED